MVDEFIPSLDRHFFVVHPRNPICQVVVHHSPAGVPHPMGPVLRTGVRIEGDTNERGDDDGASPAQESKQWVHDLRPGLTIRENVGAPKPAGYFRGFGFASTSAF